MFLLFIPSASRASMHGDSFRKPMSWYRTLTNNRTNLGAKEQMVVYTVGTFDMLHVGHLALLEQCRRLGNVVAVGVASDQVVNSYKQNKPVIPLEERVQMLKSLRCVDIVRPYYELEYVSGCEALDVDIFVVGEDWGHQSYNIEVESFLNRKGSEIVKLHYDLRTSSTQIKKNVLAQLAMAGGLGLPLPRLMAS